MAAISHLEFIMSKESDEKTRIELTVILDLSPREYELLANYAEACGCSIGDAIGDAALTGITLGLEERKVLDLPSLSEPAAP